MERWEYIEIFFSVNHRFIYIYPGDKVDTTKIKQAFKKQGETEIKKENDSVYLYLGYSQVGRLGLLLVLNTLGQTGWEAFSASDTEEHQSVFLKRRIEK